jgi:CASP C terminal
MQSYRDDGLPAGPTSTSARRDFPPSKRDDALGRYRSMYEESMNPFEAFRGRVRLPPLFLSPFCWPRVLKGHSLIPRWVPRAFVSIRNNLVPSVYSTRSNGSCSTFRASFSPIGTCAISSSSTLSPSTFSCSPTYGGPSWQAAPILPHRSSHRRTFL